MRSSVSVRACAVANHRLADQPAQEPQVRGQTQHDGLVERPRQAVERICPVVPARDDLGEHRIEPATDLVALGDAGIDPDALPGRPSKALDAPGRGQEPVLGILGVEADLDRVAVQVDVGLRETQRFARGDAELVGDQVAARRELGDRVLDLEPRVHLEERERASVVQQELAGPGAHIADGAREREGRFAHRSAQRGVDGGGGRLLEHLLVAPLDRAVALAEVDAVALAVEQDLDLDVPGAFEESLEDQSVVVEGGLCLASGGGEVRREAVGEANRAHALAAATGRRLDQQGIADALGRLDERCVRLVVIVVAGGHGDAEARRELPAGRLVAHGPDGFRWWPDPADPGLDHALGEVGVLGEEAEARVEGVGVSRVERRRPRPRRPGGRRRPGRPCGGVTARMPSRSQVRAIRVAISPRLAMKRIPIGPSWAVAGDLAGRLERANRVKRDTPATTNPSGRQRSTGDPALNRPCRRPKPPRDLARAQFVAHRVAIVALGEDVRASHAWLGTGCP